MDTPKNTGSKILLERPLLQYAPDALGNLKIRPDAILFGRRAAAEDYNLFFLYLKTFQMTDLLNFHITKTWFHTKNSIVFKYISV